ncbi:hypothetical protein EON66_01555 [archaeon]|nr:MAG: hypothetical protein EON66_01555 [archaeon]
MSESCGAQRSTPASAAVCMPASSSVLLLLLLPPRTQRARMRDAASPNPPSSSLHMPSTSLCITLLSLALCVAAGSYSHELREYSQPPPWATVAFAWNRTVSTLPTTSHAVRGEAMDAELVAASVEAMVGSISLLHSESVDDTPRNGGRGGMEVTTHAHAHDLVALSTLGDEDCCHVILLAKGLHVRESSSGDAPASTAYAVGCLADLNEIDADALTGMMVRAPCHSVHWHVCVCT